MKKWTSRPIFISSTFKDMQSERDYLRSHVFPRIEEKLLGRCCQLEPIDLRQGVEEIRGDAESTREQKILRVCLEEIQLSQPYLIVLLGDRYGWIPPESLINSAVVDAGFKIDPVDMSVTALEIEYGVFHQINKNIQRCFFFFREPLAWEQIPLNRQAEFSDKFSQDEKIKVGYSKLSELKKRIESNPTLASHVHTYHAEWDATKGKVAELEDFGNIVYDALWPNLEKDIHRTTKDELSDGQELEETVGGFFDSLSQGYIKRENIERQLLSFTISNDSGDSPWAICITGSEGSGKSSLIAKLATELQQKSNLLLLSHSCGVNTESTSINKCLQHCLSVLCDFLALPYNDLKQDSSESLERKFYSLLQLASKKTRVIILLDAIDQFDESIRSKQLTWIDPKLWPDNTLLIATSIKNEQSQVIDSLPGGMEFQVPPIDEKVAREILSKVWHKHHRQAPDIVIAALINKTLQPRYYARSNPLWLTLAAEHLNNLDSDDFNQIQMNVESNTSDQILELMLDHVEQMPCDVTGLYHFLFSRAIKAFGETEVKSFLALLIIARSGWRRNDIDYLFPRFIAYFNGEYNIENNDIVTDAVLSNVFSRYDKDYQYTEKVIPATTLKIAELRRFFLRSLTYRKSFKLDFLHKACRSAATQYISLNAQTYTELHTLASAYLLYQRPDDPIRCDALPFHLLRAKNYYWLMVEYGSSNTTHSTEINSTTDLFIKEIEAKGLQWIIAITEGDMVIKVTDENAVNHFSELSQKDIQRDVVKGWYKRCQQELLPRLPSSVSHQDRLELIQAFMNKLEQIAKDFPDDDEIQAEIDIAQREVTAIQLAQHDFSSADQTIAHIVNDYEHLPEINDNSPIDKINYAGALIMQGDSEAGQGNTKNAEQRYKRANDILNKLAEKNSYDSFLLKALGVSYDKLGDMARNHGNQTLAEEYYYKALPMFRQSADSDLMNQRDLSLCLSKIGELEIDKKQLDKAEQYLTEHFDIAERLAKSSPNNMELQRDLSGAYGRLQQLAIQKGEFSKAVKYAKAQVDFFEQLLSSDDTNINWKQDLAGSYYNYGIALIERGNDELASVNMKKSAQITICLLNSNALDLKGKKLVFGLFSELFELNDWELANELCFRALSLAMEFSDINIRTQVGRVALLFADKLLDQQKNDEAEKVLVTLSSFFLNTTGNNSLEYFGTINYLGVISKRRGDLDDAERKYRQVYNGFVCLLGENDLGTQTVKGNLDWVMQKKADLSKSGCLSSLRKIFSKRE